MFWIYSGTTLYYQIVAEHCVKLNVEQRRILYTDFVRDVAYLAIALQEKGLKNGWTYHGKNLPSLDGWYPKDSNIQALLLIGHSQSRIVTSVVMVCTATFGIYVNVPNTYVHVQIGCLAELVQEFGRANRDGRKDKGI